MKIEVLETVLKIDIDKLNDAIKFFKSINSMNPYLIMNGQTNNYIAEKHAKLVPDKLKEDADINDWMEMFPNGYLRRYHECRVLCDNELDDGIIDLR